MPVVPLNAATVVPDVMPVPEMIQLTHGGLAAAVAVNVKAVDEPDVDPTPEPDDVNTQALPKTVRNSIGPFPKSFTVFGAMNCGCCVTVCANATTDSDAISVATAARRSECKNFIASFPSFTVALLVYG